MLIKMLGKLNYLLILTFLTIGCSQSISSRSGGTIAPVADNTQTDYLIIPSPDKTREIRYFRNQIQLINSSTGKILADYSNKLSTWATAAIFEDQNTLLVGGADGRVYRIYTDDEELQIERYPIFNRPVRSILSSSNNRAFFASDSGGHIVAVAEHTQNQYDPLIRGRFYTNQPKIITFPRNTSTDVIDMLEINSAKVLLALTDSGKVEIWQKAGPLFRCETQPLSKQPDKINQIENNHLTLYNRDSTSMNFSLNFDNCTIL